jgi:hypothetical protein
VEVASSIVLAKAGNAAMFGRLEGHNGGGILDEMKTLLHGMVCELDCWTFLVQTVHVVSMSLVIGELHQRTRQVRVVALGDFNFGGDP